MSAIGACQLSAKGMGRAMGNGLTVFTHTFQMSLEPTVILDERLITFPVPSDPITDLAAQFEMAGG